MKNFKFLFTALFASSMLFTSCIVDDEDEYLDSLAETPYTIGFSSRVANESYFEDIGAVEKSYPVVIIGGQDGSNPDEPIEIQYTVNTEASTATEGQEFDFVDNSGVLTIPAGSDFGNFDLLINTGNLNPDEPTKLVLDLVEANSSGAPATIASSNKQIEITFVGCNSKVAQPGAPVKYQLEMTSSRGNVSRQEQIIWTGPNNFQTESVGYWSSLPGCFCFPFEVICGEVFVPDHNLSDYYSNEVAGLNDNGPDGFVDEDGNITINYTIMLSGSPVVFNAVYTRLD